MKNYSIFPAFIGVLMLFCIVSVHATPIQVGAEQTKDYLPLLEGKRVALCSNHTGIIIQNNDTIHLLDLLIENGINVTAIFSPEHGFRGTASAGEHVSSSVDEKTGVPILSLYDKGSYYPSDEAMASFDALVFDIQDVGLRFYTYYITMTRLMQACTDKGKPVIVLDRPNPNGYYVDGPILDMQYKSGVGYLPIPVVHGMTLGELALMINGEGWLKDGVQCDLTVIPCQNYTHQTPYDLPMPPSPNLKNMLSIYLYPSTCYFEATQVSLGRGTDKPFLCYGHPDFEPQEGMIEFTPHSMPSALKPPQQDNLCYGWDLSEMSIAEARQKHLSLEYVIDAFNRLGKPEKFFTAFFEKLIGVSYVREMIYEGKSADEIEQMWQKDVQDFLTQRKLYLLYEE